MINSVEEVIQFLEINDLPFFAVYNKNGENNKVFESGENESFEDAKNRFRKVMDIAFGNYFILKAKKDFKSTRGMFTEEFRNNKNISETQPAQQHTISGIGDNVIAKTELDRILRENEDKLMIRLENQRLKQENEDLKKERQEYDTAMNRIIKRAEPYVGTLLGAITNKVAPAQQLAVAGLDDTIEVEATADEQQRMNTALNKWQDNEPDFLLLIEKLADMAENKDSLYVMAKNQIFK